MTDMRHENRYTKILIFQRLLSAANTNCRERYRERKERVRMRLREREKMTSNCFANVELNVSLHRCQQIRLRALNVPFCAAGINLNVKKHILLRHLYLGTLAFIHTYAHILLCRDMNTCILFFFYLRFFILICICYAYVYLYICTYMLLTRWSITTYNNNL